MHPGRKRSSYTFFKTKNVHRAVGFRTIKITLTANKEHTYIEDFLSSFVLCGGRFTSTTLGRFLIFGQPGTSNGIVLFATFVKDEKRKEMKEI